MEEAPADGLMRKSRERDKKVAIACGLGVLAVAGLIALSWDGLRAWYVGYRFVWMPEGAAPQQSRQSINISGEVARESRLEPQGSGVGLWSLATGEVIPVDVPHSVSEEVSDLAINDAGNMIGTISRESIGGRELVRSFLWTKEMGVKDLATLGGEQTVATAMNERGQVVGSATSPSNPGLHAFLWSAESGIAHLGSLAPESESEASAINEAGWVVGDATAADGWRHPFLWKPEAGMRDLGRPSGFSGSFTREINDQGDVLVTFINGEKGTTFIWREKDGFVKLPAPPGYENVWGAALNNRGTVLLEARPSEPWRYPIDYLIVNGDIKELPGAPDAESTRYHYSGLNDKGWLVGVAQPKDESTYWRGFVALPVR